MKRSFFIIVTALALPLAAGAVAAENLEFHQRIKGLVRAAPPPPAEPPPPACESPQQATPGTISANFCGHEGEQMLRGWSSMYLFDAADSAPGAWTDVGKRCTNGRSFMSAHDLWYLVKNLSPEQTGMDPNAYYWTNGIKFNYDGDRVGQIIGARSYSQDGQWVPITQTHRIRCSKQM